MTETEMTEVLLAELNRQAGPLGGPWLDDREPDNVCIDGWIDVTAIARAVLAAQPKLPRVRHRGRDTTYDVLGLAKAQVSRTSLALERPDAPVPKARILRDDDEVMVYRADDDGRLYVRFADEFTEDRFEEIEHG